MSATNNPFGFVPSRHIGGGAVRSQSVGSRTQAINGISATDTNPIYIGQPVKMTTAGVLARAGTTDVLAGIFAGCEYDTAAGNHVVGYWPGTASSTNIVAYYYSDPNIAFTVQCDGSLDENAIFATANCSNANNGSTATYQSQSTLSSTVGTSTGQFLVLRIVDRPDNASGDLFTVMEVKINESLVATGAGTAGI